MHPEPPWVNAGPGLPWAVPCCAVFHSGIRPRGGGAGWGGADEPFPSMGYGAKPQKIFLSHFPGGAQPFARGGFAPPGECLNETLVLCPLPARRSPRSASTHQLLVSAVKRSTIGSRSFSVARSTIRNSLPVDIGEVSRSREFAMIVCIL
jgi:hypothetical protein